MNAGHSIKAYRTREGLTQAGLAEKIGVTRFTIGRWESGSPVDGDLLADVATATGIPAKELRPDLVEKYERLISKEAAE